MGWGKKILKSEKKEKREKRKRLKKIVSIKLGNTGIDFLQFFFCSDFFCFLFLLQFFPSAITILFVYRQHPAPFFHITILHGSIQSYFYFDFFAISDI
jgi:hypothetical protein